MINVNVGRFIPCYGYIHINPCKIWVEASSLSAESWLFQDIPEKNIATFAWATPFPRKYVQQDAGSSSPQISVGETSQQKTLKPPTNYLVIQELPASTSSPFSHNPWFSGKITLKIQDTHIGATLTTHPCSTKKPWFWEDPGYLCSFHPRFPSGVTAPDSSGEAGFSIGLSGGSTPWENLRIWGSKLPKNKSIHMTSNIIVMLEWNLQNQQSFNQFNCKEHHHVRDKFIDP